VLSMALASAIHFAGYEYARTGTLTLVTSERTGFSSSSVVPFAMGCVSPCSLLLLWVSYCQWRNCCALSGVSSTPMHQILPRGVSA
jgi:hypothetical protein